MARLAVAALALAFLGLLARALRSPGFIWEDDYTHLAISFSASHHPLEILNVWGRPLMTLVYIPASLLPGDLAVRATSFVMLVTTAALTWRVARADGESWPAVAALCVVSQPMIAAMGLGALPGMVFSMTLAVALWLRSRGSHVAAALVVSLLPLARLEGLVVLAAWGVFLLIERRPRLVPLLATAAALWATVGALASGDPLWLIHNNPYPFHSEYARAGWRYLFRAGPIAFGPGVLALAAAAIVLRRWRDNLVLTLLLALCGFYALVWGLAIVGSAATPTYLASAAVPMALTARRGLLALVDPAQRRWRWGLLAAVVAGLLFLVSQPFGNAQGLAALGVAGVVLLALLPARHHPRPLHVTAAALLAVVVSGVLFTPSLRLRGLDRAARELADTALTRDIAVAESTLPSFAWYNRHRGTALAPAGAMDLLGQRREGYTIVWDSRFAAPGLTAERLTGLGYVAMWTRTTDGATVALWRRSHS